MQRVGNLFDSIIDYQNLRLAFHKAMKGKRDRKDARAFAADLDRNLDEMARGIETDDIRLGRSTQFVIHDPKRRTITAPCFGERVLHHAVMNVCEPVLENWLISDTYACRIGKGRIAALQRALKFSRRDPRVLKLDAHRYFESIPHQPLFDRISRKIKDQRVQHLFQRIIRSHRARAAESGRGLPIGSLTSQHLANFYLGWFDRFVKEQLHVRGYVRYMDDCLLWAETGDELRELHVACADFLRRELNLEPKPPEFLCVRRGVEFLGCRVFDDHLQLNRRSRNRFRHRLRRLEADFCAGLISERELQDRATALLAFTRAGGVKSWRFRTRVIEGLSVGGRRARTG